MIERFLPLVSLVALALSAAVSPAAVDAPCGAVPAGIVEWWPGDGDNADVAGGHDGAISGSVTYAAGFTGQAFAFDGGWLDVPSLTELQNDTQITIAAWVKLDSGDGRILDKVSAGGSDGFSFGIVGGRLRFAVGTMGASGASFVPTGGFVHLVAVNTGSALRVYLNGAQDGSHNMSMILPSNGYAVRLGAARDGTAAIHGLLDEIQIYSRGLSAAEIVALYEAGAVGLCRTGADLSLTALGPAHPAPVGSTVTCELTVINAGLEAATAVNLTQSLPAGLGFVSAVADRGDCLEAGGTVTCAIGTLQRGEKAAITVSTTALAPGAHVSAAAAASSVTDPLPENNTAETTTQVFTPRKISGRVFSAPGVGLRGVRVRLLSGGRVLTSSLTTAAGRYTLADLMPGTYVLKPVKKGWLFTPAKRTVKLIATDLSGKNFSASTP